MLKKPMAFLIRVPEPGCSGTPSYPALYLLHGSGHDRWSVLQHVVTDGQLEALGNAVLVIPDGDQGWWLDSPVVPNSRYAAYFWELVQRVETLYPTDPSREARGVCGFSMGGFGAMRLCSQYPDRILSASSLLGTLDISHLFPTYYRLSLLLGSDLEVWRQHNPTDHVDRLAHTGLWFCTGQQAFDRPQNDAFSAALEARGIASEYHVYAGDHDTAFVRAHTAKAFGFHRRTFDQAATERLQSAQ